MRGHEQCVATEWPGPTLFRTSDFPPEHHDRILRFHSPDYNVRRAKSRRASPARVLLRECAFNCDVAPVPFAAHGDPLCVVGIQPAECASIMSVPGLHERIGESSRT